MSHSKNSSRTDVGMASNEGKPDVMNEKTRSVSSKSSANDNPVDAAEAGDVVKNETVSSDAQDVGPEVPVAKPGMFGAATEYVVLAGLLLAAVLMAFDGTMIVTSIPVITKEFDSIRDIGWYGSVYFLALVLAQPMLGSLFFQLNTKYVFFFALLVFEVGSIVAATAQHSYVLIIGRAIAGAGGAGLFSGALIIANFMAADDRKPIYVGLISSTFGLGSAAGPILGGVFTQSRVTWRFNFWLSLPIGFISFITVLFYPTPRAPGQKHRSIPKALGNLDYPGILLLTTSLVCLLLALQWGGTTYAWSDSRPVGLLVGFAVSLVLFLAKQQFIKGNNDQILSFRILKIRTIASVAISELFFVMAVQVQLYYLPIYFQVVKGQTPLLSGVYLIPYLGAMALSPIVSGILVAKLRIYQPFLWFGLAIFVVGSGLLYTITPTTTSAFVIGAQILLGFGVGLCMQTIITAIQSSVAPQDIPLGTSLHVFMIALGPSISLSAAQQLFIKQLIDKLIQLGVDPTPFTNGAAVATPSAFSGSPETFAKIVEAYSYAMDQVFLFTLVAGSIAFLAALAVSLKRIPKMG